MVDVTGATLAEAAVAYAHAGLAVFPLAPDKSPLQTRVPTAPSQTGASTDAAFIAELWDTWPAALIGHRVTAGQVLIDIDPRHGGEKTWRALRDAYGDIDATRAHFSGRNDGGGHIWWHCPLEVGERYRSTALDNWAREHDVGESIADGRRWTAGIDLLHHGHRYTILPPSPHPDTGLPYRWRGDGLGTPVAPVPPWLRAYIVDSTAEPAPTAPTTISTGDESIIGWFNRTHRLSALLGAAGWRLVGGDGDSTGSKWRHPTATAAVSATVRDGSLYVYTPNTVFDPTYPSEPHGYDTFDIWCHLHHRGDKSAAARAALEERDGPRQWTEVDEIAVGAVTTSVAPSEPVTDAQAELADGLEHGWHPADVRAVLTAGWEPPRPSLLLRPDGQALLYTGRINGLFGESGSGKSWMAMHATAEALSAGTPVLYIDLEDHLPSVTARLLALGVDADVLGDLFDYIAPDAPYTLPARVAVEQLVNQRRHTLVVIDSTGEAMALDAAKQNDDDAVAQWHRRLPKAIAALGPAVVLIDHVPKAADAPSNYSIGSQRKRAAIDGALYRVDPIKHPAKGKRGEIKLTCAKDRNGSYRVGEQVAHVIVDANTAGDDVVIRVLVPESPERPTVYMERVSRYVELHPGAAQRDITGNTDGRDAVLRKALDQLIVEGHVRVQRDGRTMAHYSVAPFRRDELVELIGGRSDGAE